MQICAWTRRENLQLRCLQVAEPPRLVLLMLEVLDPAHCYLLAGKDVGMVHHHGEDRRSCPLRN